MPVSPTKKLTPPQVAKRYGVKADKVLAWVRSGELRAFNAATHRNGRPRFLIDESDLLAFEQRRSATPATPVQRRRKASGDVIEFF